MNLMKFICFLFILGGMFSCTDDSVEKEAEKNHAEKGVFILNEGNYGSGNASLSFYEPDSLRVTQNVFQKVNEFLPGDALQSIKIIDSLVFMTVSNSGKILVFHSGTFRYHATIPGLMAPRYLAEIHGGRLVVSDLHDPFLKIVSIADLEVEDKIYLGTSSEQMLTWNDFLFVTSWSFNNKLYKISIPELEVTDSLVVGIQPNSLVLDHSGKLWVLCDGGYQGNSMGHENPRLLRIDPQSLSIEREFIFNDIHSSPSELCLNNEGDTLYFLNGGWSNTGVSGAGIFRMPVNAGFLPDIPFIAQEDRLFYGLGIDPETSEIYCSDAIDYLQKGIIFRYDPQGDLIDSFHAGIIPGCFAFR